MKSIASLLAVLCLGITIKAQRSQRLGKLTEVYAWQQISYNINGQILQHDRASDEGFADERPSSVFSRQQSNTVRGSSRGSSRGPSRRFKRQNRFNNDFDNSKPWIWDSQAEHPIQSDDSLFQISERPSREFTSTTTSRSPVDEAGEFFIQYNNVPMGAERVGNRLFVTVPRRRYGIPSTLNYLDLNEDTSRSPSLRPYPSFRRGRSLVSVYRTRADICRRLWMVDTGRLEIPSAHRQVQPPAIVVYNLDTDEELLRYEFKQSDLPAENTPTGLASITVEVLGDCSNAYAYVPDLTSHGLIVYSLRDNDSWRLSHNYFHFNPVAGNLNVSGSRFQWSDGVFSVALGPVERGGCRPAYFHPLVSYQEFTVSTCILHNRTASSDPNYFTAYTLLGERGNDSQSTMHGVHDDTRVMFFADIGHDALSCWNIDKKLEGRNVAILARDSQRLNYPSDLHVTGNEVWVVANRLPRFGYTRLNRDDYNFFIYKGIVQDLIAGTVCDSSNTNQPPSSLNRIPSQRITE